MSELVFQPSEWTRVEDGLPETDGGEYWVQERDGGVCVATFYGGNWSVAVHYDSYYAFVIAYAPYHEPDPPKWMGQS